MAELQVNREPIRCTRGWQCHLLSFYEFTSDRNNTIFFFFFFQRAYSLPARTHTPSSQNRINLRRCVRREPPPHPARLRKHRHGWTLHLEHPLEASKCTRSLVLLIVLLLGVGAVALYIALGKWYTHDKLVLKKCKIICAFISLLYLYFLNIYVCLVNETVF